MNLKILKVEWNPMLLKVQSPAKKYYGLWVAAHVLLFLLVNQFIGKKLFEQWLLDGYFSQMNYVAMRIWADEILDLLNPFTDPPGFLGLVQWLRFMVGFPFYLSWLCEFPIWFDSILISIFLLPILFTRFKDRPISWLQPFFIYLPVFFSYRAVLVMCGVAYLFIYLYLKKSSILLILSLLFVNLSSGVVLFWLMITVLHSKCINKDTFKSIFSVYFILVISFSCSLVEKISFFSKRALERNKSEAPIIEATEVPNNSAGVFEILETIFSRNTIVSSLYDGDWQRFIFYIALTLAIVLVILTEKRIREFRWSFLACLPLILVEGLGAVSILIVLIYYYLYFFKIPQTNWEYLQLTFRKERKGY